MKLIQFFFDRLTQYQILKHQIKVEFEKYKVECTYQKQKIVKEFYDLQIK